MKITVREFWKNLIDYPERLTYYDCAKNENDVFTDKSAMNAFIEENADREVASFVILLDNKEVYISIK